jgi:hypothetical protein
VPLSKKRLSPQIPVGLFGAGIEIKQISHNAVEKQYGLFSHGSGQ